MDMKSFIVIVFCMFCVLSMTYAYGAKTIFVPRDYAIIQDAIMNASDGDTVRVASGRYASFKVGKNIRVVGEDRDNTIISGSYGSPGIRIPNRTNATVEGFTVKEGGKYDNDHYGGIVVMNSTGVVIKNCVIRDNSVASDRHGASGVSIYASEVTMVDCIVEDNVGEQTAGVYCKDDSTLVLKNTIIRRNKSKSVSLHGYYSKNGAGLFSVDSSVEAVNCVFEENEVERNWSGSAIFALGAGSLTLRGCRISDNTANMGAAITVGDQYYGTSSYTSVSVADSVFEDNDRDDIYIYRAEGAVEISRCVFRNTLPDGGTVYSHTAEMEVDDCLFDGSSLPANVDIVVANSTFVNCDQALNVGTGWPGVVITNCIFWDNDSDLGYCEYATITYSCLQEAYAGTGNITDNPEFVDPESRDYRLSAISPCIDTGDKTAPGLGDKDLEGKPRVPAADVDMGCYEYPSFLPIAGIDDIDDSYEYGGERVVRIVFSLYYADSSQVNLSMDYSLDGGDNWNSASGTFSSPAPFDTSPLGVEYEFYWDAAADLGTGVQEDILLRIFPAYLDGQPGFPAVSDPFDFDTRGDMVLNRSSFTFNVSSVITTPSGAQALTISNGEIGSIEWSIAGIPSWLDVTPGSGIVDSEGINVEIEVLTGGLSTGTYEAELTLNSFEAFNTPQTIKVTVNVGVERIVTPDGGLGIQETIDICSPGDVVKVMPGRYEETIVMAPDVSLVGTDMDGTVIVGDGENPVITADDIDSVVIRALTLKRGSFGLSCTHSYISVEDVAARYNYDGGFAFYRYSGTTLKRCAATNNASTGLNCNSQSKVTAENCLFANNGYAGVQAIDSPSTLMNCTVANNAEYGVLARLAEVEVTNCIVFDNRDDLDGCEATYSLIGDGDAGTRNISSNPGFAAPEYMNYHIVFGSPCINGGTTVGAPETDFEGDPRAGDPDMGYDEYIDGDGDSMQDAWEEANGLNPGDASDKLGDADSDGRTNYDEYVRGSDPQDAMSPRGTVYVDASAVPGGNGTEGSPFLSIQDGIDAACYGDIVIVAGGAYDEEVVMKQMVSLRGAERDYPVIALTDEESDGILCFGLTSGKIENFKLSGPWDAVVTVGSSVEINNCEFDGAALSGLFGCYAAAPVYRNILFTGYDASGACLWMMTDVIVENCTAVGNDDSLVRDSGFFAYRSEPVITNSIIRDNHDDLVGCTATYSDISDGDPGTGNILADPLFVTGPHGGFYLSQKAAGQGEDSPCVNTGSESAGDSGLDMLTTRTDGKSDKGIVDMGYHYPVPFQIYFLEQSGDEVTIKWNNRAGISYVVQWSADLENWTDVPVGETGSWIDTVGGLSGHKYYRVWEQ